MLEDKQNLVENEQKNDLSEPPDLSQRGDEHQDDTITTAKLPLHSPPSYTEHAQSVVTCQPVVTTGVVGMLVPWDDEAEVKTIRNKAITSATLSTALSVSLYPLFCSLPVSGLSIMGSCLSTLFCSLPAFVLGILALCTLRKEASGAKMYANVSLGLMIAAVIFTTVLFLANLIIELVW